MKNKSILFAILIGMIACGGSDNTVTTPGTGPGFSADMTATTLWRMGGYYPYADGLTSETFDCAGGGKAESTVSLISTGFANDVSYDNCKHTFTSGSTSYTLVLNGTATLKDEEVNEHSVKTTITHISFSGDIGYAADCDYSSGNGTVEGKCTYVDSEEKTLSINGAGMRAALGI